MDRDRAGTSKVGGGRPSTWRWHTRSRGSSGAHLYFEPSLAGSAIKALPASVTKRAVQDDRHCVPSESNAARAFRFESNRLFKALRFVLPLAGIWQLVVQIKAITKEGLSRMQPAHSRAESVHEIILQNSIATKIRQVVFYMSNGKG